MSGVKSGQPLNIFYFNVFLFLCLNSIFQFSNRLDLVMSFAYHFSRAGAGGYPCLLDAVVYCCTWLHSLLWLGVFLGTFCILTLFRFDESIYSSCWQMPFDLDLLFTNHLLVLDFFSTDKGKSRWNTDDVCPLQSLIRDPRWLSPW